MIEAILSIDPGRKGAATLLSVERGRKGQGVVLDSIEWRESKAGGSRFFRIEGVGDLFGARALVHYLMGEWIVDVSSDHDCSIRIVAVVLEGMVIPTIQGEGRKSAKSIITLIEETGAVADALRVRLKGVPLYRPTASAWRGRILKIGFTRRAKAEAYAMESRDRLFQAGHGLHSIHQVESACMALHGRESLLTGIM